MRNARLPLSFESLFSAQLLLLFVPTLVSAEWVEAVSRSFYTLLMLASLYMVSTSRRDLVIGIALFVPVFITRWMSIPFFDFEMQTLAYCIFQIVFLIYVMRKVYGFLLAAKKVDTEIIYASIILYIIFGLCLSLVYYGTLIISPGSLGADLVLDFNDRVSLTVILHDLIYFSFVTQTTLGYGDISPVTSFTRALASVQALLGHLYVAVIIARLVGVQIATTLKE